MLGCPEKWMPIRSHTSRSCSSAPFQMPTTESMAGSFLPNRLVLTTAQWFFLIERRW